MTYSNDNIRDSVKRTLVPERGDTKIVFRGHKYESMYTYNLGNEWILMACDGDFDFIICNLRSLLEVMQAAANEGADMSQVDFMVEYWA